MTNLGVHLLNLLQICQIFNLFFNLEGDNVSKKQSFSGTFGTKHTVPLKWRKFVGKIEKKIWTRNMAIFFGFSSFIKPFWKFIQLEYNMNFLCSYLSLNFDFQKEIEHMGQIWSQITLSQSYMLEIQTSCW